MKHARGKTLFGFFGLIVLAFIAAGCQPKPYDEGVNRANREIKEGAPCIYTTAMAEKGQKDLKTGLPYLVLEDPETPDMLRMIEGHNETMYAHFQAPLR